MFKPRQPRVHDKAYLQFVRELPCLCCAVESRTTYGVDACHIRFGFGDWRPIGMAEKPDDLRSWPGCRACHESQHGQSERVFWARLGVNPVTLCADLRAAYPDVRDGTDVVEVHAHNARQAKRAAARVGGLSEALAAAPEPVTVHAHLSGRRDARGNREVILSAAGEGKELIAQRAYVTPDSICVVEAAEGR